MKDENKTRAELIDELKEAKARISEFKSALKIKEAQLKNLKESEEYLKKAERTFATAFLKLSIPAGITTIKEGRYVAVNEAFLKNVDRNMNEVIGKKSTEIGLLTPEQRAIFIKEFNQKGAVVNLELPWCTKEGELRYGLLNSVRISLLNEDHFLTIETDITNLKRTEKALRDSRELFLTVFNSSPALMAITRLSDGTLIDINKAWLEATGLTKDEVIGRKTNELNIFVNNNDREYLFKELIENGKVRDLVFQLRHKSGRISQMLISMELIEMSGEQYLLGIAQDITERKLAQQKLERYRSRLEELVTERTQELEIKTKSLEEINIALKVLLQHRKDDKKELEDRFVMNVKQMIIPYAKKLKCTPLNEQQLAYLGIMETNLTDITSSMIKKMHQFNFTPTEMEVASLIKEGKSTKEIASIMGIATSSVNTHRNNIRKKLGISKENVNLQSHLHSFE